MYKLVRYTESTKCITATLNDHYCQGNLLHFMLAAFTQLTSFK